MVARLMHRRAMALALATLVGLAALDIALGTQTPINGAYGIAALVAAALTTVRRTVIVGLLAIATSFLARTWNEAAGEHDWLVRWLLCIALVGLAVGMAQSRVQREKALLNMTVIAETAQRALLRTLPAELEGLCLSARYLSASDGAFIGGDLYEVLATPYGVRVLIGDARGKGLDAVQMAGTVLGAFRRAAFARPCVVDVAMDLDRVAAAVAGDEDFVTALLVEVHDDGTAALVNCGHHPPLALPPGRPPQFVDTGPPTRPLGLGAVPTRTTWLWSEGWRLLLYTDGLIEARDAGGAFFPLVAHADALLDGSVDEGLDRLLDRLMRHTGTPLRDDLALLLVENCGRRDGATTGTAVMPVSR